MSPSPPPSAGDLRSGGAPAAAGPPRHEVRNLLNQIIGYSELLIEEAQDWGHEGLATDLGKIRTAGQRLAQLSGDGRGPAAEPVGPAAARDGRAVTPGPGAQGRLTPGPTASAEEEPAPRRTAAASARGRILVVDDDENNRDLLARTLRHQGHDAMSAASGEEALSLLRQQPFDLVLLDLLMPGVDGEEVLRILKGDEALRAVPVVMLSGLSDLERIARCIELGAEDYLPKPFSPVLLQARIGASLQGKRAHDEELRRLHRLQELAQGRGHRESTHVRLDIDYGVILKTGGALLLVWLVSRAWSVVVLVAVSLMLVATVSPLVRRVEARLRRGWGIVFVCVGLVGLSAGLLAIMLPPLLRQGQNLVLNFPIHAQALEGALRRWRVPISLSSMTQGLSTQAAPQLINVAGTVLGAIVELGTVAVLTIYLLVDGPRVQMSLVRLLPRGERLAVRQVLGTLAERVGSYMRGQLLTSLLAGLFSFLLLVACHIPEPLALAVWMALADAIPLVGLIVGMVPAVLLAMPHGGTTTLTVAAGYLIYHQFETSFLVPRIYGSTMQLSGSVILVSILIGAKLMGITGALFALPVAAAVPVLLRYIGQWRDRQADRRRGKGDEQAAAARDRGGGRGEGERPPT